MATRVVSQMINLDTPVESVSKYINTINDGGIKIHPAINGYQNFLQIDDALKIYKDNKPVATYGETISIGISTGYHLEITNDKISFVNGDDPSIPAMAYISNEQLYIPRAVVVDNLQIGDPDPLSRGAAWKWFLDDDNNMGLYYIGIIGSNESES